MKHHLGWLIGGAAVIGALAIMPACGSDSGSGDTTTPDSGLTVNEGGLADVTTIPPTQDGAVPVDSGSADSGEDATIHIPACNDGTVDLGETCDPLSTCPTACPPVGCQLRSLDNGGTCSATCTNVAVQTQCLNGDGCCPTDCNTTNDSDCIATCGNGIVETGETCDGNCPTTCAPVGCQTQKVQTTNGNACTATCVNDTLITSCSTTADKCCPSGCNVTNDADCGAGVCGNGTVDVGETCDDGPNSPMKCPTSCPANGCNLEVLTGKGTCQAKCTVAGTISACVNKDGCCATGCNASNDSDCQPVCGNGVIEPGETCEGASCPTSCPQKGCQTMTLQNPNTCTAQCVPGAIQTQCVKSDGCCPTTCNASNDNDCSNGAPTCGNGKVEPPETCDGNCPTCGAAPYLTCFVTTGSAATCDLVCNQPVESCNNNTRDTCCPYGKPGQLCGATTDPDCTGDSWQVVSIAPVTIPAGTCLPVAITGVNVGGAYDLTTCSPIPPDGVPTSTGNPRIAEATQKVVGGTTTGTVTYHVQNDDCTEPSAVPQLAGWNCGNTNGLTTMACASPDSGGFIVNYASPISTTICAGANAATTIPISVFYNAKGKPPTILTGTAALTPQ